MIYRKKKNFFKKSNEVESWKFRINKQYENELSTYSSLPIVPSGPNSEVNEFQALFQDGSYKILLGEATFVCTEHRVHWDAGILRGCRRAPDAATRRDS